MRIDSPFSGVGLRQVKMSQVDAAARFDVVQMGCLQSVESFGVGVVQDPLIAGQIREMSAAVEDAAADLRKRWALLIGK